MVERCRFCVRETYKLSRLISASWIMIMMLSTLRSLKYWFDEIIGEKLFGAFKLFIYREMLSLYVYDFRGCSKYFQKSLIKCQTILKMTSIIYRDMREW